MTTTEQLIQQQRDLINAQRLNTEERAELIRLRKTVNRSSDGIALERELDELRKANTKLEAEVTELKGILAQPIPAPVAVTAERAIAGVELLLPDFDLVAREANAPVQDEAKTIGLKINPELRSQIEEVQKAYGLRSYKHTLMACLLYGVRVERDKRGSAP